MKTLVSIQYLRAFAALAVVMFHACQWSGIDFDIGASGVDVFFVISGFLMWSLTLNPAVTPAGFLWRRLARVAPLYWIATLALAAMAIAAPKLLTQLKPTPSHLALSLLFVPHLDPAGVPFPFLPPGWTLNYEVILYLVFALALSGPRAWRFWGVIAALGLLTLLGVLVHPLFPLFANPMMLEFAAGVALARLMGEGVRPSAAAGWGMIGAGLAAFAALRLFSVHSDIGRWVLWGAPALAIVAGALGVEARGGLPRSRTLRRLGDASYAIYLCHWPVVALASRAVGGWSAWVFVPLTVLASLAIGVCVHHGLEKPIARRLRHRAGPAIGISAL